jgi:hypothetical protein
MDAGDITFLVIVAVIIGIFFAWVFNDHSDEASIAAFFWPVTLPVLLVFGLVAGIKTALRLGWEWIRDA